MTVVALERQIGCIGCHGVLVTVGLSVGICITCKAKERRKSADIPPLTFSVHGETDGSYVLYVNSLLCVFHGEYGKQVHDRTTVCLIPPNMGTVILHA